MTASRIASSRQGVAPPGVRSSLVRRLVAAENDPAKQRIRVLLAKLEDERLSGLGLTLQDILILRGGAGAATAPGLPRAQQEPGTPDWQTARVT
jgi:hypothetical protein